MPNRHTTLGSSSKSWVIILSFAASLHALYWVKSCFLWYAESVPSCWIRRRQSKSYLVCKHFVDSHEISLFLSNQTRKSGEQFRVLKELKHPLILFHYPSIMNVTLLGWRSIPDRRRRDWWWMLLAFPAHFLSREYSTDGLQLKGCSARHYFRDSCSRLLPHPSTPSWRDTVRYNACLPTLLINVRHFGLCQSFWQCTRLAFWHSSQACPSICS